MQTVCIADPKDQKYPFAREIFDDRLVLYHGTWSSYSPSIESNGLLSGGIIFDLAPFVSIRDALKAVGGSSFFAGFHEGPYSQPFSERQVCFSTSFWGARAYATDAGGEVVRLTIRDADTFERICTSSEVRLKIIDQFENALLANVNHVPTLAAVAALRDEVRMRELYSSVAKAKQQLIELSTGGHAVVYAVRVEPSWFGDNWERYVLNWEETQHGRDELACRGENISPERLVGRVDYPNGTDMSFDPSHVTTWKEIEEIGKG